MAMTDPIADMLTRIRNAGLAKHPKLDVPSSNIKEALASVLKDLGYIKNFKKVVNKDGVNTIRIFLKYDEKQNPVLHGIDRISTPGRRVYSGYRDMPRVYNGYGVVVVSTSSGIITGKKASEKKVGGELICSIW